MNDRLISDSVLMHIAPRSRRSFFETTAKVFGVGATAALVNAQQSPAPGGSEIDVLNYALTLEYLEATFYSQFLGYTGAATPGSALVGTVSGNPPAFTQADATSSRTLSAAGSDVGTLFSYLTAIRDHEVAHVTALRQTITSLGGTPVQACSYIFSAPDFDTFVLIAQALENTGVSAYDGAINRLRTPALLQASATIATIEARHAAFLNLVAGGAFSAMGMTGGSMPGMAGIPGVSSSPFPTAVDVPLSAQQVLAIAGPFLGTCTTPPPQPAPVVMVTPNNTTVRDASVMLTASMSGQVSGAPTYQYQVAPGGKIPAILQVPNSPQALIQFVNGPGIYLLQLDVRGGDQMFTTPISLTYQP